MMLNMRTTVTIDDDLAVSLEELRKREGLSFKSGAQSGAEDRLGAEVGSTQGEGNIARGRRAVGTKAWNRSDASFNSLVDEIETDEFAGDIRLILPDVNLLIYAS